MLAGCLAAVVLEAADDLERALGEHRLVTEQRLPVICGKAGIILLFRGKPVGCGRILLARDVAADIEADINGERAQLRVGVAIRSEL